MMAALIARLALALIGLMGATLFAITWFDLPRFSATLGPVATSPLAAATLRADAGGFFALWALGAFAAAMEGDRRYALAPMLLLGVACLGRAYTYAMTFDHAIIQPMVIEAVLVVLIALCRRELAPRQGHHH